MKEIDYEDESQIIESVKEVSDKIAKELSKEKVDKSKVCKMRFEQLLRGMYLQNTPMEFNNRY